MSEQKKASSKLLSVAGGGGIGMFLMKLPLFSSNPVLRDAYMAAVPLISIALSELFSFAWTIFAIDPHEVRLRRKLRHIKVQLKSNLDDESNSMSPDMRLKAQKRYDTICGIEMGIYPLSIISDLDGVASTGTRSQESS
ncbi:hypothetical protein [Xenorhabdus griffiniae]|uniref:hypothetical protein n=1 Tax=Xenorhabdus griffiniae TaxID=351672 RepID=UPI0030D2FC16